MKINWADVPAKQKSELHTYRQVKYGSFSLVLHEYSPGWELEWHSHRGAEFRHVLQGEMKVWIEGETIEHGEGESVFVPSGAKHMSAVPAQKTVTLTLYLKSET